MMRRTVMMRAVRDEWLVSTLEPPRLIIRYPFLLGPPSAFDTEREAFAFAHFIARDLGADVLSDPLQGLAP